MQHEDSLLTASMSFPPCVTPVVKILLTIATQNEANARRVLNDLEKLVDCLKGSAENVHLAPAAINAMKQIGFTHKSLLGAKKNRLQEWKSIAELHDVCQQALDFLEGRSLSGIDATVTGLGAGVSQLDSKVQKTHQEVGGLKKEVGEQRGQLNTVTGKVKETEGRVAELGDTVQVIGEQVEEIDHKVMRCLLNRH